MDRSTILAQFPPGAPVYLAGSQYAPVDSQWLITTYADWFKQWLFDYGVDLYAVKWECRDFADAWALGLQICNADTKMSPGGIDRLAGGRFWFIPDGTPPGGPGHAIGCAMTELGLTFVDPQLPKQFRTLSQAERDSLYLSTW
jgi:hypothetical protein